MKKTFFLSLFLYSISAFAEKEIPLNSTIIETYDLTSKGIVVATVKKMCLDGQAYLLMGNDLRSHGLTVSFKDGKPEQCKIPTIPLNVLKAQ
ncbi:hypothetical protein [Methylophilus sp. QUAN]|uniref:hypothetical protein n=1 Tax=Methylophilus sp. QUAN TaxID=2781020 RepID=UPI00188E35F5|nr:hypothetical protein [Methylophilus sp. QUAN]MBF4991025.1 hypothetical protein [Methylophilus sp. QUAN]